MLSANVRHGILHEFVQPEQEFGVRVKTKGKERFVIQKTAEGLVAYAKAQLGRPYWYGTFGQKADKELYKQKKKQYPEKYDWEYAGEKQKVHDCVGLIKGYLWCGGPEDGAPVYDRTQDQSANAMYTACKTKGQMDTMPEVPGILVFFPGHVGVYIGGGEVIEARSRRYGVCKTKLTQRPWKTWGYCPYVAYETEKTVNVELPVLKKGAKGDAVKAMQMLLIGHGAEMGKYGADGSFGGATEAALKEYQSNNGLSADGSCGRRTWTKLLGLG